MSTDPSIPPVPPESTPPAPQAVVPAVEDKTVAIIAYVTFIGFIVALVLNNGPKKNALGQFHLRQALGLIIFWVAGLTLFVILGLTFSHGLFGLVINLACRGYFIGLLVLFILGLVDAVNGRRKPVPVVGELIQQKLAGAFAS